jgi:hypothetical protein
LTFGRNNGERRGQSLGSLIANLAFPQIQCGQALRPCGGGELGSEGGGANVAKKAAFEIEACKGRDNGSKSPQESSGQPERKKAIKWGLKSESSALFSG